MQKLEQLGARVTPFEIHLNSLQLKILKRLSKSAALSFEKKYYDKALEQGDYDYVLVRHGYQRDCTFYASLKTVSPNARFINFHWDALKPTYDYRPIIGCFDKIFSFDYKDCEDNPNISYLPLFFIDDYLNFEKNAHESRKEFDILFIGAWRNEERYNQIKITKKFCEAHQLKFFYFLHHSIRHQFRSLKKGVIPKDAKSKYLSHAQILSYFAASSCIIDFPSSFQSGLTMRTFETLGAGKKLITTNQNILREPFYNPEYINVIDPQNIELNINFIKNKPVTSMENLIENYSIENYIYKLLDD